MPCLGRELLHHFTAGSRRYFVTFGSIEEKQGKLFGCGISLRRLASTAYLVEKRRNWELPEGVTQTKGMGAGKGGIWLESKYSVSLVNRHKSVREE